MKTTYTIKLQIYPIYELYYICQTIYYAFFTILYMLRNSKLRHFTKKKIISSIFLNGFYLTRIIF